MPTNLPDGIAPEQELKTVPEILWINVGVLTYVSALQRRDGISL
jgi:hypothetical protein